jgi:hypothetical protein
MSNSIVWRDVAVIDQVSQKITNRPCDHLLRTAFVVEENEALSSRCRLSQSDSSFLAAEWLCGLDPAAWAGWLAEIAAVVGSSFTPS